MRQGHNAENYRDRLSANDLELDLKQKDVVFFTASGWQGEQMSTRRNMREKKEDFLIIGITAYDTEITLHLFFLTLFLVLVLATVTDRFPDWPDTVTFLLATGSLINS